MKNSKSFPLDLWQFEALCALIDAVIFITANFDENSKSELDPIHDLCERLNDLKGPFKHACHELEKFYGRPSRRDDHVEVRGDQVRVSEVGTTEESHAPIRGHWQSQHPSEPDFEGLAPKQEQSSRERTTRSHPKGARRRR